MGMTSGPRGRDGRKVGASGGSIFSTQKMQAAGFNPLVAVCGSVLKQLEPFAYAVEPGMHEKRAIRVSGGIQRTLAQKTARQGDCALKLMCAAK